MSLAENEPGYETCGATTRQGGGHPCRMVAGWGTDHLGTGVCRIHLGNTRNHRLRAQTILAERRVEYELGRLLEELELEGSQVDRLEVLSQQVDRANAMTQVLGMMVGELPMSGPELGMDEDGTVSVGQGLYGPDHNKDGRPHVLVVMYGEWVERAGRLAKLAKDAGLDERRQQVDEDQAQMLATVCRSLIETVIAQRDRPPDELRASMPGIVRAAIEATATG